MRALPVRALTCSPYNRHPHPAKGLLLHFMTSRLEFCLIAAAMKATCKYKVTMFLQALSLALQCLSFDFVGTCLDDSSEDFGTIQVCLSDACEPNNGGELIIGGTNKRLSHFNYKKLCRL